MSSMDRMPKPMERYRHFKGQRYQIITLAQKEDTGEQLVIYQALYGDGKVFARNLENFLSEVDKEKYPDAVQRYRFEKIEPVEPEAVQVVSADDEAAGEEAPVSAADAPEESEEKPLDPFLERFLDARTTEEKLTALAEMRGHVTDEMIDTMALACDVEVGPGALSVRYDDLRDCLLTIEKYELERGRLRG